MVCILGLDNSVHFIVVYTDIWPHHSSASSTATTTAAATYT